MWVMAVEGLTARAALERSIALVSGRWWSVWWKVTVAILFLLASMLLLVLAFALAAPALFIVGVANMMAAAIVGGVVAVLVYITLISLATFFITRYTYELYCGLAATVSLEAKSWWQGLPLSILIPIGTVFGIIYILAMPYLAVQDAQTRAESTLQFDEEEIDFDAWLEANPEFRNQFDNPTASEAI
jgi:hypothetical protein